MTSPGGDIPEGAYVGTAGQSNSIARLSDISEESAKAMMQGATAPSFNRQRDAAWGVFNDIAYAITGVQVDENGNPIQHIEDWATRDIHNLGEVLIDYGDQLEAFGRDRVMPWAVPTVAPLSQTVNRWADATYQIGNMLTPHNYTNSPPMVGDWNHTDRRHFVFITPSVTRAYSQINITIGGLVSGTAPVWEFAIYVMDEDGVMDRVYGPHRFTDGLGLGDEMATIQLDSPVVVDQGSYVAVGFRKVSGGERYLLGLLRMDYPLPGGVLPPGLSGRMSGGEALPTVVNARTQIDFGSERFVPYVELSESVGTVYRAFTENWGHGATAPRPWVTLGPRGIYSHTDGFAAAWIALGYHVSMYDTPLSTDYVRVRTSINWVTSNNFRRSTLIVRGSNDLRSGVGLSVINTGSGNGRYEVIQWSNRDVGSDWNNRTVLAVIPTTPQAGQTIEVDYLNGVVDVSIGGVKRIDGLTVGGPVGAAGRFVGIQMERTGGPYTYEPSPHFGPWSARDLPQENGDEGDDDEGGDGPIVGG